MNFFKLFLDSMIGTSGHILDSGGKGAIDSGRVIFIALRNVAHHLSSEENFEF